MDASPPTAPAPRSAADGDAAERTAAWMAYLVRCADGSLYAGVTTDLERRLRAHNTGTGARYTRSRGPVALAWRSGPWSRRNAQRLEWRIKQLGRMAKLHLVRGGPEAEALLQRLTADFTVPN